MAADRALTAHEIRLEAARRSCLDALHQLSTTDEVEGTRPDHPSDGRQVLPAGREINVTERELAEWMMASPDKAVLRSRPHAASLSATVGFGTGT